MNIFENQLHVLPLQNIGLTFAIYNLKNISLSRDKNFYQLNV